MHSPDHFLFSAKESWLARLAVRVSYTATTESEIMFSEKRLVSFNCNIITILASPKAWTNTLPSYFLYKMVLVSVWCVDKNEQDVK